MQHAPVRPKERFLVFGAPQIEEAEIEEVVASLRSGWLGTGPKVAAFEQEFRAYRRAHHAVAVSSCTAGLHLALLAAGVGPGDEVITTPLTFCATVNAIIHAGATPVLADVDPHSFNLDLACVREKLTPRTKAIVPVHFAGRPCDMAGLIELAEALDLRVIEDCAHAIETEIDGRAAGTFGDFGCFSFYVTKNVCTAEGGMVLARRPEDAARLKRLALHGMSQDAWQRFSDTGYRHYTVVEAGFKYNMTDLQAALGLHQLGRIERSSARREAVWERYQDALRELPLQLPAAPAEGTRHARHLYSVLLDEAAAGLSRDELLERMTYHNIGVGVHYLAIPEHPYYAERYGMQPEDTPIATAIGRRTLSLPLSAALTDDDVDDVVTALVRSID
jgi:dTDP-4-amino-4,6-dideoxygalactose transaminase